MAFVGNHLDCHVVQRMATLHLLTQYVPFVQRAPDYTACANYVGEAIALRVMWGSITYTMAASGQCFNHCAYGMVTLQRGVLNRA